MTADELAKLEAGMTPGPWRDYDGIEQAKRGGVAVISCEEGRCYADVCCGGHGAYLEIAQADRDGIVALRNNARMLIAAQRWCEARDVEDAACDKRARALLSDASSADKQAADAVWRAAFEAARIAEAEYRAAKKEAEGG